MVGERAWGREHIQVRECHIKLQPCMRCSASDRMRGAPLTRTSTHLVPGKRRGREGGNGGHVGKAPQ